MGTSNSRPLTRQDSIRDCEQFLHDATSGNHVSVLAALRQTPSLVHALDHRTHSTALTLASYRGHFRVVEILLQSGASVSWADEDGRTPLTNACMATGFTEDHMRVVRALVRAGADPNGADHDGDTALTFAAIRGHANCVRYLLEQGAFPNPENWEGTSALMHAAKGGYTKVVKLLTQTGKIDLRRANKSGITVLMLAAIYGQLEIVKMLRVSVNQQDEKGRAALYFAVKYGHTGVVDYLFHGVRPKDRPKEIVLRKCLELRNSWNHERISSLVCQRSTPKVCAIKMGGGRSLLHDLVVQEALDANICAKLRDMVAERWLDMTPCQLAAEQGYSVGVSLLLIHDPEAFQPDSESPLLKACAQGHFRTVEVIMERIENADVLLLHDGKRQNALIRTVGSPRAKEEVLQRKDIVRRLFSRLGGSPFADLMSRQDQWGHTFFWHACKNGHSEIVQYLYEQQHGGLLDMSGMIDAGVPSPFWIACNYGHVDVVRILLGQERERIIEHDAFVPAPDGTTPLTNALVHCNDGILHELQKVYSPEEMFMAAARFGCPRGVAKFMRKAQAREVVTALQKEAFKSDSYSTVKILLEESALRLGVHLREQIESVRYKRDSVPIRSLLRAKRKVRTSELVRMTRKYPVFNSDEDKEIGRGQFWKAMETRATRQRGQRVDIDLRKFQGNIMQSFCSVPDRADGIIEPGVILRACDTCKHSGQLKTNCDMVRSLLRVCQLLNRELTSNSPLMRLLRPVFRLIGSVAEGSFVGSGISDVDISVSFEGLGEDAFAVGANATDLLFNSDRAMEILGSDFSSDDYMEKFDFPKFFARFLSCLKEALGRILPDLPAINLAPREMQFRPCKECRTLSRKRSRSVYQPWTHCAKCTPAVTHTKVGACLNFLWTSSSGTTQQPLSMDLVPVFPLRGVSAVDLHRSVNRTLLDLRPPSWLDFYKRLTSQDRIVAEELDAQSDAVMTRITLKIVHYGEGPCNHIVRPVQQIGLAQLERPMLKRLYCFAKAIRGLTGTEVNNMLVKKLLLTPTFVSQTESGSKNVYELLRELLGHPEVRDFFSPSIDFEQWRARLEEHRRKGEEYPWVPLRQRERGLSRESF